MLFEKTYGIDLGSSSVKVYSFFRNKRDATGGYKRNRYKAI